MLGAAAATGGGCSGAGHELCKAALQVREPSTHEHPPLPGRRCPCCCPALCRAQTPAPPPRAPSAAGRRRRCRCRCHPRRPRPLPNEGAAGRALLCRRPGAPPPGASRPAPTTAPPSGRAARPSARRAHRAAGSSGEGRGWDGAGGEGGPLHCSSGRQVTAGGGSRSWGCTAAPADAPQLAHSAHQRTVGSRWALWMAVETAAGLVRSTRACSCLAAWRRDSTSLAAARAAAPATKASGSGGLILGARSGGRHALCGQPGGMEETCAMPGSNGACAWASPQKMRRPVPAAPPPLSKRRLHRRASAMERALACLFSLASHRHLV